MIDEQGSEKSTGVSKVSQIHRPRVDCPIDRHRIAIARYRGDRIGSIARHEQPQRTSHMGAAIGAILPLAIGVAISPIPIIAVVLLLSTPRGKGNAIGLLVGWLVGLSVVGTAVLLLADSADASTDDGAAGWVGWLILGLGALLIILGIKRFAGRPRDGKEPPLPKWMAAIDQFSFGKSIGFGFVLSAVNPKNLTLTLAAAASIAALGLSTSNAFAVLAVFVVIGSIGLAIPVGIYLLAGQKATDMLNDLRHWLAMHNAAIMSVLFVIIGAKLLGDGIAKLFG